jgi:hypothetical protein
MEWQSTACQRIAEEWHGKPERDSAMLWNSTGKKSNGIAKTSVEMERQSMEMTGDGVA